MSDLRTVIQRCLNIRTEQAKAFQGVVLEASNGLAIISKDGVKYSLDYSVEGQTVKVATEFKEWEDTSGNDDHGRGETASTKSEHQGASSFHHAEAGKARAVGDKDLAGKHEDAEQKHNQAAVAHSGPQPDRGRNAASSQAREASYKANHHNESFTESCAMEDFQESASVAGSYPVTVIKAGLSKNNRFYSAEMLKRDYKIFEGCKMFANHQTEAEMKVRPEGDVRDWVANLSGVHVESDGTIKGICTPVDPTFAGKLDLLKKQGLLSQMGVSIRAMGSASEGEVNGKKAKIVESLTHARSVDFVTFAGAGGHVETN